MPIQKQKQVSQLKRQLAKLRAELEFLVLNTNANSNDALARRRRERG